MLQTTLDEAMTYARAFIGAGKVATYIPELSKADPTHLGACLTLADGRRHVAGNWDERFTMQSISKVVSLLLALQTTGYAGVFEKVGMEPTGDAFNSIVKLETRTAKPSNPMINAGAIVVTSCIRHGDPFGAMLSLTRRLCLSDAISLNEQVFLSEKEQGMRNRAMAYFMQSEGILTSDVEHSLDLYFKMCSVSVDASDLANMGLVLANDGVNPFTGERVAESWQVRIVKTLMVTCGMYNSSGEFAIKVGIPSKSGVGGGIVSSVGDNMGIGVYGPALDEQGNSIGSFRVLEYLSERLGLHMFGHRTQESLI